MPDFPLPSGTRVIELNSDQLLAITPNREVKFRDISSSPLGTFTQLRYILDRNNNISITEILTTYPDNRIAQGGYNIPFNLNTLLQLHARLDLKQQYTNYEREQLRNRFDSNHSLRREMY
jgi:hypothetical protein